jgi:uncharacterized protein (DUF433 family)
MSRKRAIFNKFIDLKNKLPSITEKKIRQQIVFSLIVLYGRWKESHRKSLLEKEYAKNYREINREKIRNYHSNYARIRKMKQKVSSA